LKWIPTWWDNNALLSFKEPVKTPSQKGLFDIRKLDVGWDGKTAVHWKRMRFLYITNYRSPMHQCNNIPFTKFFMPMLNKISNEDIIRYYLLYLTNALSNFLPLMPYFLDTSLFVFWKVITYHQDKAIW